MSNATLVHLLVVLTAWTLLAPTTATGFIRPFGSEFVDDQCRSFVPVGWNSYQELNHAAADQAQQVLSGKAAPDGANPAQHEFVLGQQAGFTVMRMFAHGDSPRWQLQTAPGQYNDYFLRGLDYALNQAAVHNIKVIVVPVNHGLVAGTGDGLLQYVKWAGLSTAIPADPTQPSDIDHFWTSPVAKGFVKDHLRFLATHVNVFSGRAWKDDPTIFAWDLYNEMRCPYTQLGLSCADQVTAWVGEMAAYLKSVDPNHMVTVGEEGFFDYRGPDIESNPTGIPANLQVPGSYGRYWAAHVGQDFVTQHSSPNIDFAAVHLWPVNWNTTDPGFVQTWLAAHMAAAKQLGKPLIVEEFGYQVAYSDAEITAKRDPVFRAILQAVQQSLAEGGPLRGDLFWRWDTTAVQGATTCPTCVTDLVRSVDSTFR
ncbi:hypothetical protein WJX72_006999 [[Myrmecia] bisecta]|uniref:mannan endo-1,4-beta-mannosidase n=1 Tax=[Myrmecia] bisecta TaxID=41462 RepID=A0AAW1Q452_9CHLO